MTDEELFTLIALECGVMPLRVHRPPMSKAPPLPGTTQEWLQRFIEVCTVAGRNFEFDWQVGELRERYRHWYEQQRQNP